MMEMMTVVFGHGNQIAEDESAELTNSIAKPEGKLISTTFTCASVN